MSKVFLLMSSDSLVFMCVSVHTYVNMVHNTVTVNKNFHFVDKLLDKQEDSEVDDSTAQSSAVNSPAPSLRFVYLV